MKTFLVSLASGPIICRLRFLGAVAAVALSSFVPVEQGQAQLYLDIFPSRDNTNQTLWLFSGSSSGWAHNNVPPRIRASGSYDR